MQKDRHLPPASLPAFAPVPRRYRQDGWTPQRQKDFIAALADIGSVKHAAARVGMSPEGAYALRRQPGAEEFGAAWLAALDHGIRRLEDIALERAIHGTEVPVYSYGKLIGSRTVYNDRLIMFMLRNRADARFAAAGASGKRINIDALLAQARAAWEAEQAASDAGIGRRVLAKLETMRGLLEAGMSPRDEPPPGAGPGDQPDLD